MRFFTPIDLAVAIRRVSASPSRQPLPEGAEAILLDGILADLHREGRLRRLDPGVHGVDEAVAGSLTDLREGAVGAREYARALRREDDPKLHDLAAIYGEFDIAMATLSDRSSLYEDALDPRVPDAAVREALGDAPLVVIGLYDAPAVQVRLLARCADVADVRVVLVAPPDPEFDFARGFGQALARAGATVTEATVQANAFTEDPAYSYFGAPSRQAEAEEIVRRILALAREHGLPFNQVAILHRLESQRGRLALRGAAARGRARLPRGPGCRSDTVPRARRHGSCWSCCCARRSGTGCWSSSPTRPWQETIPPRRAGQASAVGTALEARPAWCRGGTASASNSMAT